jgi:hypothetical protein
MMSYCDRQREAVLKVCANCRRAVYMTVPSYEICMACRAGCPPLGPIMPTVGESHTDVNGVEMTDP